MKYLLFTILFSFSIPGFSQELFLHEFDENLSLKIPDGSEEGELKGELFVRGSIGENVLVILKTKGLAKLADGETPATSKFFQGMKDGMIKGSKGSLIKEEVVSIKEVKSLNLVLLANVNGQPQLIESYIFIWDKFTYTLQFMSPEKEATNFTAVKTEILDSITLK